MGEFASQEGDSKATEAIGSTKRSRISLEAQSEGWQSSGGSVRAANSESLEYLGVTRGEGGDNERDFGWVGDGMGEEDIPSLGEQRVLISRIWEKFLKESREGDLMAIVPSQWSAEFLNEFQEDCSKLGPMDISSIVVDHENMILASYETNPYVAVPEPVFLQWKDWYGLAEGSVPVYTVLIRDREGNLVVEYDRPKFRVHYLVRQNSHDKLEYRCQVPIAFSMSVLSPLKDVVARAAKLLYQREYELEPDSLLFRAWCVNGTTEGNDSKLESFVENYKINTAEFINLPEKQLLGLQKLEMSVKEFGSDFCDLALEFKPRGKGNHWPTNYFMYNRLEPSDGTMGLVNLGNTCYMNSALQCLVHIPELRDYFLYNAYEAELNVNNPLGYKGKIAHAFGNLIQALFGRRTKLVSSYSPRLLKSTIGQLNYMFTGYQQQDSQEFLAFLLDGLHEDLNRIIDKPYVVKPELDPSADVTTFEIINKLATETWNKHKLRNDSIIMDLFVGLYKSTLICPTCEKVSITFDPYNDLTLPLPVDSIWSSKVQIFPYNSSPYTLEVKLNKTQTYSDLKEYIGEAIDTDPNNLLGIEVFNHQVYNNYEASNSDSSYMPINELISDSDTVVFYELPRGPNDTVFPVLNTVIEDGFKSAKLCGFPFFITLSEQEQCSFGIIQQKLEQAFFNLSGGYKEFPIISRISDKLTIDSLPLLSEKYPNISLSTLEGELNYVNPERNPDEYFKIKVYNGTLEHQQNYRSPSKISPKDIWAPEPHVTFTELTDLSSMLPPVLKDAYYYSYLSMSAGTRQQRDSDSEDNQQSAQDSSEPPDVDYTEMVHSASDMDIEPASEPHPEDDANNKESLNRPCEQNSKLPKLVSLQNAIICEWNHNKYEEVFNAFKINWTTPSIFKKTDDLVKEQDSPKDKHITLDNCLTLFSTPEVLGATDSWYCPSCKEHCRATKQIELWNTPDILLIHLKRFENQRFFSDKISDVVHFPITDLDMTPYVVYKDNKKGNIYDLFAVDNHYGGLGGGHYTAYVKNYNDNQWYYFDDARVKKTVPERSIAGSAYLLFYRRRVNSDYVGSQRLFELISEARRKHNRKLERFDSAVKNLYEESISDEEDEINLNEYLNGVGIQESGPGVASVTTGPKTSYNYGNNNNHGNNANSYNDAHDCYDEQNLESERSELEDVPESEKHKLARNPKNAGPARNTISSDSQETEEEKQDTAHGTASTVGIPKIDHSIVVSSKNIISPYSDYSIASLEVGEGDGDIINNNSENDQNNSRRKLRLLQKTYTSESSDIVSPVSASSSSTGSITNENADCAKIVPSIREKLPNSPSIS